MATKQQIPTLVGEIVKNQVCLEDMPVEDAQWVIQNPAVALSLFVKAVMNRGKKLVVKKTLTVWRTIAIGGTTTDALLKAIETEDGNKERNEVTDPARDLMSKPEFCISPSISQVSLVVLTPAELDFTSPPCTDDFMTKGFCVNWSAKNLDGWVIELCEAEDGPQLRLQYQDQPKGGVLWIAMERIAGSGGGPRVFSVERYSDGLRRLDADCAFSHHGTWDLGSRIVFRLRKVPSPSAT